MTTKASEPTLEPQDMTDEELSAALDFHRAAIQRLSNEGSKIWRLRIRLNDGTPEDKQMLAALHERRNTRVSVPTVDDDDLHFAICQAVHLMNQGDLHAGHDLLRQTLIDYADKKAPLTRTEIVRQQQRSGPKGDPVVMVSPATDQMPYCNPCQSYHPVSQPCFDAATAPKCSQCGAENGWHRTTCSRHPRFAAAASTVAPQQSEPQYLTINGQRRMVIPCPDGIPGCEVLHTAPAPAIQDETGKCIHCDPSFVPTGPDDWCGCRCHVSSYSEGVDDAARVSGVLNKVEQSNLSSLARKAATEIAPALATSECPWCRAHPHREPCCFQCASARDDKRLRAERVDQITAIIERCLSEREALTLDDVQE